MEVRYLGQGVYAFLGAVNLGAIVSEGFAVLVDAGLDEGPARKLWRWAEENGVRPQAAILTHAHADHFGGAHFWDQRGLPLYASAWEGAMMVHPLTEPLFLFCGATPPPELHSKFTLARPCGVHGTLVPGPVEFGPLKVEVVALPGHAPAQVGVRINQVLFCADALFLPEILAKHPIPFCYDLDQALASLAVVKEAELVVPGHGSILMGADVRRACEYFRSQLQKLRETVWEEIANPKTAGEILAQVARKFGESFPSLTALLLAQTTVHAALASLVRAGVAEPMMEENQLLWRRR
ncbi:MAG: MBL fold metallo-hydrolase [Candidatus Bipolaricaulaceae bacterium]